MHSRWQRANPGGTMTAHEHNRRAWDAMVQRKQRFAKPANDREFENTLQELDPRGWLGPIASKNVLCLAAGGGRQGPIYAAGGAHVTVVDISAAQLELDREVAAERGIDLRTVQTSMDDLSMFRRGEFDLVIQPVSTCYVPDVRATFQQIANVTVVGGIYVSQHKQPTSLQSSVKSTSNGYEVTTSYFHQGPLPPVAGSLHREEGTLEFLHSWEATLGGMCRAGFCIEDLCEPVHANPDAARDAFGHRSQFIPPYVRVKARRTDASETPNPKLIL